MADAAFGVIGLVAGSSVVASLVTVGTGWLRDKLKSGSEADFAAIYLAHALEEYASKCSEMISDSEAYDDSGGSMGEPRRNIPKLPGYPAEADLKSLGKRYAIPALNYRVKVDAYRAELSALWDFDDDETVRMARKYAAELGLEGLNLADLFRRARDLGERFELDGWTVRNHLIERKEAYEEKEREREKRRAERAAKGDDLLV